MEPLTTTTFSILLLHKLNLLQDQELQYVPAGTPLKETLPFPNSCTKKWFRLQRVWIPKLQNLLEMEISTPLIPPDVFVDTLITRVKIIISEFPLNDN
jgi:hypothetical protein